jgi:protein SCO1/2
MKLSHAVPFLPATLVAIASLLFLGGCHQEPQPEPVRATHTASRPGTAREYHLAGEVRGIDKESGQVVIRHEDIAGLMKAMTMPFTLKDRTVFDDLQIGDAVEGTLRVSYAGNEVQDYALENLVVTKPALAVPPPPAPPPSLTLRLRGGEPRLEATPRRLEPGAPVPDFTMTLQDGRKVALAELRGNVVVLTFIYTRCPLPDFCPLMDRKFASLAAAIEPFPERAAHVRLISLSFDPEHDTPEVLTKHARIQGARSPLWTFAVATHDELAKVAPALGLTYGPTAQDIMHNLSTAIIDPDGKLDTLLIGPTARTWTTTEVLKRIYQRIPPSQGSTR